MPFVVESMYITRMDETYSVHLMILKGRRLVKVQLAMSSKELSMGQIMQRASELFPKTLGGQENE